MPDYNKVGLLAISGGRILLCRKNTLSSKLILPGGCLEANESPMECLAREIREELGENTQAMNLSYIGTYEELAASEDPAVHKTLRVELYRGEIVGDPIPSSEIVELVWFGADSDRSQLTPILTHKILPDLLARGVLAWCNHLVE